MALTDFLSRGLTLLDAVTLVLGVLFLFPVGKAIYNIYFHPLARYPGPKTWTATRLGYVTSQLRGNLVHDIRQIHDQYGEIVRLAPNELSFATPEAWQDILSQRSSHKTFLKNPIHYSQPPDQVPSLVSTTDVANHARMRKIFAPAFTDKALKSQEPLIQYYVDLLIRRLRDIATAPGTDPKGTRINIVDWINYVTFDVISDLAFGESFHCLEDQKYHQWVWTFFAYIKSLIIVSATRFYPLLELLLQKIIPKSLMQKQKEHYQMAVDKIHNRLNLEKKRDDLVGYVMEQNSVTENGLTMKEIECNFNIIILAGSETSGTTLCGIFNNLMQNPSVLSKLVSEVRGTFREETQITMASTKELPYLNGAIWEGLRLCNPVPLGLPRLVPKGGDTVCGHFLPENTNVSVQPVQIAHSSRYFHKPYSFVPDRWLPASDRRAEFLNDNLSAIQPFGLGARNCIGQKLAWAEMRLILARVVWAFDIEMGPDKGVDWEAQKVFFLVQKRPLEVGLKVRAKDLKA